MLTKTPSPVAPVHGRRTSARECIRKCAGALVFLGAIAAATAATSYKVTPLDLPSLGQALPTAIGESGLVLGIIDTGGQHGCVWVTGIDGTGHALFPLAELMTPATVSSNPTDVNANDLIVGYFSSGVKDHACSWQGKDGALVPLSETGLSGVTSSRALAVSDSGLIVGDITYDLGTFACTWNGSGNPSVLQVPNPDFAVGSSATGVSGDLVVGTFTDNTGTYSCAWHDGVLVSTTGFKEPAGAISGTTFPAGANASGLIVGSYYDAGLNPHVCTWLRGSAVSDVRPLADLALGGSSSVAGVNASGLIVGSSGNSSGIGVACAWFEGVPFELPSAPNSIGSVAAGVNDRGHIVAFGLTAVGNAPYLLTPVIATKPAIAPPTVRIKGKKKVTTAKEKLTIKGSATGSVTSVTYRIGKKKAKAAKGLAAWKFKTALKPGKNKITITAHGPGGDSAPAKVTVTRKL